MLLPLQLNLSAPVVVVERIPMLVLTAEPRDYTLMVDERASVLRVEN